MLSPGAARDWKTAWYATSVCLIITFGVSGGNDLRTVASKHDSNVVLSWVAA